MLHILSVGTDAEVLRLKQPGPQVIDLHGKVLKARFAGREIYSRQGASL